VFDVRPISALPLLANEKIDRRAIASLVAKPDTANVRKLISKAGFLREVWQEFIAILQDRSTLASCVFDIFVEQFGNKVHALDDSFIGLEGDSMAAVAFAIQLEDMCGTLPDNWPSMSISQLERLRETRLG